MCSFEPLSFHDVSAHAGLFSLDVGFVDTEELGDNVVVVVVVHEVELSLGHVFELGVINELAGEVVASSFLVVDHPDTFDIEIGFFTEHQHAAEATKREFSVTSLHPSTEEVGEFEVDLTFISISVVLEVPVGEGVVESGLLEFLLGLGDTFASHVFEVDEESLVIVKDEVGLDELVSFNLLLFLLDNNGLDLGGLDLNLEDGLHGLGTGGDDTTDFDERGKGDDALEPGSGFTHSFAETCIEHSLEGHDMTVGDN